MRRLALLLLLLLPLGGAPASGGQESAASSGQVVTRVVSVVPAATEMIFAMGAGDLMVGVGSYDRWPPEVDQLPRIGAYLDPDFERIIALGTDLAIIDAGQTSLAARLAAAGIESYRFEHGSIEDAFRAMAELGEAIGRPEAGASLAATVRDGLDAVRETYGGLEGPRALLVFGRDPGFGELWVVAGGQFLHELLVIAGGRNVFGDVDRLSFKTGLEAVFARRPDWILEFSSATDPEEREAAAVAALEQWRGLPGFSGVRVELLPAHALVPGPRMVETARYLGRLLHADEDGEAR